MSSLKSLLVLIFCTAVLSACGLKGPLYLPDDNADNAAGTAAGSGSATQQEGDTDEQDAGHDSLADTPG